MSDNCDLLYNYDGIFTELTETSSWDYDVHYWCECGIELIFYVDSPCRCKNCGRVYQVRTILDIGDKIVSSEEYEKVKREYEDRSKEIHRAFEEYLKNRK